jgi:DNA-binding GntR family transcriptional regulator
VNVELEPLSPASLVDQACSALRRLILAGDLRPGEELRQEVLATQLRVSRTPLREALNRLAADGLVELRPHRSAVVARVAEEDVAADYEARRILEPAAARLAAERAGPESVAALRRALAAAREAGDDVERQFEANRAFHRALVAASGNEQLVRFHDLLWSGRIAPVLYARQARQPGRRSRDHAEHAEIVRLVAARDGDAAARAVDGHLSAALASLRESL